MRESFEFLSEKQDYLRQTFGTEDEHLRRIREHAEKVDRVGMQLSPHEGRLLQCLVKWSSSKKILELGTLFGYSCLWMLRATGAEGKVYSIEKNEERYAQATEFLSQAGVGHRVELRCGEAFDILPDLEGEGPFDFVFIDANKGGYYESLLWAEKHLKTGGFVVGDNSFLFGGVYGKPIDKRWSKKVIEQMRMFNERLADPQRYQSTLLPTSEGMTVAQKLF